jgi:hypothetical protein
MPIQYISPLSDLKAELKPLFSNEYMLAFFKKFCEAIQSRIWRFKRGRNARYDTVDFLRVFFYSEITGRSIRSASERLNRYFLCKKKGKRRIYTNGHKKREIPHQTDVNKFLRKIGLQQARNILRECLFWQLKEALEMNLISQKVNILIDFTEHAYYGKRDDNMIKGTNRQKGTKKMRHYLGFSILSRDVQLFAGLEQVANGQSKIPIIIKFLDSVLDLGFELNYVIMDREFYRAELLDEIKGMKGNVLIPAKSYKKIKKIIEEYIQGTGNRVRKYTFSSATEAEYRFFQNIYLVLNAKKGHSLLEVKQAVQKGKLPLNDASKLIYAIMTTQKPRGESSSWASRTSRFYRKRWNIERGFCDLNRMGRRWKSKYDNTRYLDLLVRMLLYNSWKINRVYLEKYQKSPLKREEWTLQDNQDALDEMFLKT